MKYLIIIVRKDLLDIFCSLAGKNNVLVVRIKENIVGNYNVHVSYTSDLDLYNLGIAFSSFTITFISN